MLSGDIPSTNKRLDRARDGGGTHLRSWQPSGGGEALATFDRVALHCVYSCAAFTAGCIEDGCQAWILEDAAAGYLAGRLFDAQDCSD